MVFLLILRQNGDTMASEDTRSSDPNRCGYPTSSNSLLKDFYMGSIIASKYNESYEMKLIRRRNIWISSNYRERV